MYIPLHNSFLVALLFLMLKPVASEAANDTASRLIAQTSSEGVVNGTWWKRDSMSISYAFPHTLDVGTQWYFTSPYVTNWRNNAKLIYYYSSPGRPDSTVGYMWDGHAFNLNNRSVMQTNTAGQIIDRVDQNLVPATTTLGNFLHQTYTYNAANILTDNEIQKWNATTSSWYSIWRYAYALNAANKATSRTSQFWDTASKVWINSDKQDTTYNSTGSAITSTATYKWDTAALAWQGVARYVFTNNTAGQHTSSDYDVWDVNTNAWVPAGRHFYSYDAIGNLSTDLYTSYNKTTAGYDTTYRDDYTYNSYNQVLTSMHMPWQAGQWMLMQGAAREVYYYQLYNTTGIKSMGIPGLSLSLFPMPANDKLSFRVSGTRVQSYRLTLRDINGRIHEQMSTPVASSFNGSMTTAHLPTGNYTISIQDENGNIELRNTIVVH